MCVVFFQMMMSVYLVLTIVMSMLNAQTQRAASLVPAIQGSQGMESFAKVSCNN